MRLNLELQHDGNFTTPLTWVVNGASHLGPQQWERGSQLLDAFWAQPKVQETFRYNGLPYAGYFTRMWLPFYLTAAITGGIHDILNAHAKETEKEEEGAVTHINAQPVALKNVQAVFQAVLKEICLQRGIALTWEAPSSVEEGEGEAARSKPTHSLVSFTPFAQRSTVWMKATAARRALKIVCAKRNKKLQLPKPALHQPANAKRLVLLTKSIYWREGEGSEHSKVAGFDEQVGVLLPALRKAGWKEFVLLDLGPGTEVGKTNRARECAPDTRWHSYDAYDRNPAIGLYKTQKIVLQHLRAVWSCAAFRKNFTYQGVPVAEALEYAAIIFGSTILPQQVRAIDVAEEIAAVEGPGAILATSEYGPRARALFALAKPAGTPTIGLMHGHIGSNNHNYDYDTIARNPQEPGLLVADKFCVWGYYTQEVLTENSAWQPSDFAITGNWRYDGASSAPPTRKAARAQLGIAQEARVLYLTTSSQNLTEYAEAFLQAAKALSAQPIIRFHPDNDKHIPAVEALAAQYGFEPGAVIQNRKQSLQLTLAACDVLCAPWSTVIAEAALAECPAVLVHFLNFPHLKELYGEVGIAEVATNAEELQRAVETLLNANSPARMAQLAAQRAFLEDYYNGNDGQAATRVAEVLNALCAQKDNK